MQTIATLTTPANRNVFYARLYDTLEGYAVPTPAGLVFVDHDQHIYALAPEHAAALTLLEAVTGIEQANVLAAAEEVRCG